ncbi:MAG: hypothetical protein IPO07_08560 [Haliscomenobacter sp.]|nr:hypothetical protein [Haliscomenobacter sp.]MBK9488832.1 hypothetical protein [Haliscomenobacter sp.]
MKMLLCAVILLLAGQMLLAQPMTDSKGHRILDYKGRVYLESMKLGKITKDSIVKNAQGKKIAFVRPGGILVDENGKTLGQMGKDGKTYYDANGQLVFKVKENTDSETCDILDAEGNVIGNVHNTYKPLVCAMHCFMNGMDLQTHKKVKK